MSYDITFVRPEPGQTLEDAIEALEELDEEDLDVEFDAQAWERVVARARGLLGEINVEVADDGAELDHEATGIQLSYSVIEAGLSVPYWHTDDEARRIMGLLYQLGRIVETETGLTGYDPQLELPLAQAAAREDLAPQVSDATTKALRRDEVLRRYTG